MTATTRPRLDAHLVQRGLARSRGHAAALVAAGRVLLDGVPAARPAVAVRDPAGVTVLGDPGADFASRAGEKLDIALETFAAAGLAVAGRDCLDAGASTGGFTDVLLRRGARSVLAVDVGHDQLRPHLRADPRVTARDGLDVRDLAAGLRSATSRSPDVSVDSPDEPAPAPASGAAGAGAGQPQPLPASLVVADLSFVPLAVVLPALTALTAAGGDLITLVKPQFEVGRRRLPRTGVVRDPVDRAAVLVAVASAAGGRGWGPAGAVRSGLAGRTGNVEFVVWWRRDAPPADPAALTALAMADLGGAVRAGGRAAPRGGIGRGWEGAHGQPSAAEVRKEER